LFQKEQHDLEDEQELNQNYQEQQNDTLLNPEREEGLNEAFHREERQWASLEEQQHHLQLQSQVDQQHLDQ
jgi:hypothetical protein